MIEFALTIGVLVVFLIFISFLHARSMSKMNDDWNYTMWDVLDPRVNTSDTTWQERSKRPEFFAISIGIMMTSLRFGNPVIALMGSGLLIFTVTDHAKHPLVSLKSLSR